MPTDDFGSQADSVSSPSLAPFAITPNDSADLAKIPKALWVGTGGDVAVRGVNNASPVVFRNVPNGFIIPVRVVRVLATGTTATDIVAL